MKMSTKDVSCLYSEIVNEEAEVQSAALPMEFRE